MLRGTEIGNLLGFSGENDERPNYKMQYEINKVSDKIRILRLNWKLEYIDGGSTKLVDLYTIKSNKWVDLSHIKWSKYYRCFWVDHISTETAFKYMLAIADRSIPYFSKWLKKEIIKVIF